MTEKSPGLDLSQRTPVVMIVPVHAQVSCVIAACGAEGKIPQLGFVRQHHCICSHVQLQAAIL